MKCKYLVTFILLICSFSIFFTPVNGQEIKAQNIFNSTEAEELFNQAIDLYKNKDYMGAKQIFQKLAYDMHRHQRLTISLFMLGKSNYKLNNYDDAIPPLKKLILDFEQSHYIDDAHYMLGKAYYRKGDHYNSVREFLWVTDKSDDSKIVEKSRNLSFQIIETDISLKEINQLENEYASGLSSAILKIKHAQRLAQIGRREEAISLLQSFMDKHSRHQFMSVMKEVLKDIKSKEKAVNMKIGVVLPLSSEFGSQAESILRGIRYALLNHNENSEKKIDLIVKDTEGSIMKCIEVVRELTKDERIIGIIGELESEKTASITPLVEQFKVPLLPPIAFENGLTDLSDFVYQINGNLDSRGSLLARFAMDELGHQTFATLSPADNYGKRMTDSFTSTVDQLGGVIIAQKWYYENAEDLARQFDSIRELGMKRMKSDSLYKAYTKDMNDFQKARFDMDDIPVTSIDAIFCPIYTEDIQYVIPQLAFSNVRSQILGGQYWYNTEELRAKNVVSHVQNLIFISSYFMDDRRAKFYNFKNNYRKAMKKTPNEMDLAGYDTMLLLTEAIKNDVKNREDLKNFLDNVEEFECIRGSISFKNTKRINNDQRIIEFDNGQYKLIK